VVHFHDVLERAIIDRCNCRTIAKVGQRMAFEPKCACRRRRVDALAYPPQGLVSRAVQLAMMSPTQRNSELIANLLSHCTALGKAQMVRI
jgi:hypothetical protein